MTVANSRFDTGWTSFQSELRALAAQAGLALSADQLAALERFARALAEAGRRLNLTSIAAPRAIMTLHLLDALSALPELTAELAQLGPAQAPLALADIGTGGGVPGIPLKLAQPRFALTLIESAGKKVRFLERQIRTLGLTRTRALQRRVEALGRDDGHRARYDVAVARGVARLPTLLEYALPLVRQGGLVLAYKGPGWPDEFAAAQDALRILGGETERVIPVIIPGAAVTRRVAVFRKTRDTPARYPRGQGQPRRRPL